MQPCSRDFIMGAIDIKLYFLRYLNCNSSILYIKFIAWRHRCLFYISIAFAINAGIVAAMALLVAVVSAGV